MTKDELEAKIRGLIEDVYVGPADDVVTEILSAVCTADAIRALLPPDHVLVHVPPGWGWRGVASRGAIELCDDTGATRGELVKDAPDD